MSAEWKLNSLDSLCSLIVDCPHSTPVWTDDGAVVLRNQNIKGGRLDLSSASYTDEDHFQKRIKRAQPSFGDIVITREAPMGEVCAIPAGLRCCLGQRQVLLRPNTNKISSRFLLFALQSPYVQHQIGWNEGTGSTVSNLRIPVLEALKIPTPPLEIQYEIAVLLGALDDRIALLRETNATLEAMAQALFKSWFVDFDPVHANAGTRAATLPAELQALFPSTFTDTPQGLVPEGWQVGVVGDVAQQKKGSINPMQAPERLFEHYSLPAFDSNQVPVLEQGEKIKSNKTPLPPNAVLLSKLNPHIPRVWLPFGYADSAVCSTEFLVYSPINGASKEFIYALFTSVNFLMNLQQLVTGTSNSHQRVKPDHVIGLELVIPSQGILAEFENAVKPLFERIGHNRQQAQTLAKLRDTLLPRLISGQLRLPDAAAALAEAGA